MESGVVSISQDPSSGNFLRQKLFRPDDSIIGSPSPLAMSIQSMNEDDALISLAEAVGFGTGCLANSTFGFSPAAHSLIP